ncbi:MAG TPA: hypothetical protein VL069_12890 [Opitutus sp.]|nr:hypothetical protein [Opitutus sp.]
MLIFCVSVLCRAQVDYEQPPISYSATTPGAVTALQARIASGELRFSGSEQDALKILLSALEVPVESQLLVFSKTSLQRRRISPERPRALYFSDTIYVGWVPGGLTEVILVDPQLGPVFYTFDLRDGRREHPKLERDNDCLRCHGGNFVRDIPGVFARSLFTDETGEPLLRHGTLIVDDETPFSQRWGGWYVTGYHGDEIHRGNVTGAENGDALVFTPSTKRPDTLAKFFETRDYLRGTSDVVALLVLEHQTTVQNALTRANFTSRRMMAYQHGLQKSFKETITDEPVYDSVKSVFESTADDVVDRLLFRKAAPLPSGVIGDPAFQKSFVRNAPKSAAGHTLKDLELFDRIFEHRCSFLIYSEMFLQLPETLKTRIFDRLQKALRSRDANDRYAYLPPAEKQRIYDILIETHPDAKRLWQ